ncbi:MAG: hypothetical protein U9O56_08740 [Campylobacterota bacterium]|nr:hypothetical protein [Campylobacterota bacterium]
MKKINPFTILFLSIVIFLSSVVYLNKSYINLKNRQSDLINFKKISNKYQNLKSISKNKKETIAFIEKSIINSGIKNVDKKINTKRAIVNIKDTKLKKIDKFVNKILNEQLNIIKLKIDSNSVELVVGY